MSKILIDTNILVYGIDQDSAFFKRARTILEQEKNQLVTTSKNLIEFLAVTTKSSGYNLNNDTALEIVEEIISIGLANGIHEVATFNTKDFKSVKELSLLEV